MTTRSSLSILIELVAREADQASVRLGMAIRSEEEAGRKLALLEHYRENYTLSFKQNMASGISIWKYRNYQVFLENIDRAIVSR